jgi:hypothetical protein
MNIKKIMAREGLVILACLIIAFVLNAYLLRIVPHHPSLIVGYLKVFLHIYLPIIAIRLLIRFIIWAVKALKEK